MSVPGASRCGHGRGAGIETLLESSGSLHEGRWVPATTVLHVLVLGRLYRSELQHDATTGFVRYRSRGESFLLRRPRQADDTLTLDGGVHIDDLGSAYLNYAERRWAADADGCFRTLLVRRSASPRPGPDGLAAYRAELRPLVIEPPSALASGRAAARIEITGFSSWALPEQPALVVFGADGRPERIEFRLRYATSVRIRFGVPASGLASGATGFVTRSRGRPRADRSAPAIPGRGLSRRA